MKVTISLGIALIVMPVGAGAQQFRAVKAFEGLTFTEFESNATFPLKAAGASGVGAWFIEIESWGGPASANVGAFSYVPLYIEFTDGTRESLFRYANCLPYRENRFATIGGVPVSGQFDGYAVMVNPNPLISVEVQSGRGALTTTLVSENLKGYKNKTTKTTNGYSTGVQKIDRKPKRIALAVLTSSEISSLIARSAKEQVSDPKRAWTLSKELIAMLQLGDPNRIHYVTITEAALAAGKTGG